MNRATRRKIKPLIVKWTRSKFSEQRHNGQIVTMRDLEKEFMQRLRLRGIAV